MRDIQEINMADPKDKSKKVKVSKYTAGGNKVYEKTTPSKIYKSVTYKKGGPRTGESDFFPGVSGGPGKGGGGSYSNINPATGVADGPVGSARYYAGGGASKSSTQAGNIKVTTKKSGAGYSGD